MLNRSLYFLFHDEGAVRNIIAELEKKLGLEDYQIHAVTAEGHGLVEMPGGTVRKKSPTAARAERVLWYLSVTVFVFALIAMAMSLLAGSWILAAMFGLFVVGAQLSGYLFVNRIPNAQLDKFRTGLEQGDIVLMVDVPRKDVKLVKSFVNNRYPDSGTNISNWHIGAFGI